MVIAGAGPAGLACALRAGRDVLALVRHRFMLPRWRKRMEREA